MFEEQLLQRSGAAAVVEFRVPPESPYFDGHFPECKILSAAAQIDIILRLAGRYLAGGLAASGIKKLKFTKIIPPGVPIRLELAWAQNAGTLSFKMLDAEGGAPYASGSISMGGRG